MADLTGTTPADTYKSLLQIGDATNGVDATAKYIEDGEGTDSALAISTDKVGIGTDSPDEMLQLEDGNIRLKRTDALNSQIHFANNTADMWSLTGDGDNDFVIERRVKSTGAFINKVLTMEPASTEAMRIDSDGNVGIGTESPTAPLEVSSTTGGVIMPRMTTTQRNAIASPTNGEMVYDTDLNKFYGYANGAWTALH